MQDLESVARALAQSGKRGELEQLASSVDGRALEQLVDGAALQKAVANGDGTALRTLLASLMASPEGRRLAGDVERIMRK